MFEYCILAYFMAGCQHECSQLPRKNRLWKVLLCVTTQKLTPLALKIQHNRHLRF